MLTCVATSSGRSTCVIADVGHPDMPLIPNQQLSYQFFPGKRNSSQLRPQQSFEGRLESDPDCLMSSPFEGPALWAF